MRRERLSPGYTTRWEEWPGVGLGISFKYDTPYYPYWSVIAPGT